MYTTWKVCVPLNEKWFNVGRDESFVAVDASVVIFFLQVLFLGVRVLAAMTGQSPLIDFTRDEGRRAGNNNVQQPVLITPRSSYLFGGRIHFTVAAETVGAGAVSGDGRLLVFNDLGVVGQMSVYGGSSFFNRLPPLEPICFNTRPSAASSLATKPTMLARSPVTHL